jgi:hypothetical protein
VFNSLTKPNCPICQTGLFGFGSSNSAASFVKFYNCLFTPHPGDIKGLLDAVTTDNILPEECFDGCGGYVGDGLRLNPFREVFHCHDGEGVITLC